jgi:general transcriptional corepressor CYC8
MSILQTINLKNETSWIELGKISDLINDPERALVCYENCLKHNSFNIHALNQIASIYRSKDQFNKAILYYQRALNIETENSEIWGALGHCFLVKTFS